MALKTIVGSRRENRGGSEGTPSESVSRETTPPSKAAALAAGDDLTAGARQPSAASRDVLAFGWICRRLAAIGLAALDQIAESDTDGAVRDQFKPILDALSWNGVKLTNGES